MLHFNPKVPLTTGASLERGVKAHAQSIKVACTTLDCFVFEKVAAIKIDVERHECAVLQGAKLLIARDRPMLLIETLDDAMRQEVMRLLPHYKVDAVLDERNTIFAPQ
jgi:FkbM family methyltransferase